MKKEILTVAQPTPHQINGKKGQNVVQSGKK